jgi:hypothetical protein
VGKVIFYILRDRLTTTDAPTPPKTRVQQPEVFGAGTLEAEYSALVDRALAWREQGIELNAIGVVARAGYLVKQATEALGAAGIPSVPLSPEPARPGRCLP